MADLDLLSALRTTRDGYDESVARDQFNLDAYTGLGGFEGQVCAPDYGQWPRAWSTARQSSAAYIPPGRQSASYLVRFHRESEEKFQNRVRIAHYPGYVRTVTDLKLSFLLRRPFTRNGDELWASWYEDTDGAGTTWDEAVPPIVLRAAALGWCPCLVDAPEGPQGGTISVAQAKAAGIASPRLIPLFPANLRDWQSGRDGNLDWAKIRTDYVERGSWRGAPVAVEQYTIWTRETWSRYEIRRSDSAPEEVRTIRENVPHGWRRVPLAILRHTPAPDDPVRGIPMHSDVAVEAWRLFNLLSERDEHIRGQVFALLTMAQDFRQNGGVADPGKPTAGTPQQLGSANVLEHHFEWPVPSFIAPPASVAATLAENIASSITELYRLARIEFARGVASATSGVARAYEFAQTNQALSDYAAQVARWHEDVLDLTGITLGIADETRKGARITAPDNFDVEDLAGRIEQATAALALNLGPAADREIKSRIAASLLPNLDPEDKDRIEADLNAQEATAIAKQEAAQKAAENPTPAQLPRFGAPPRSYTGNAVADTPSAPTAPANTSDRRVVGATQETRQ